MDFGENEWLQDVRGQTKRLADLTNTFGEALSRMEEDQNKGMKVEFPLSDIVEEVCHAFQAPAKNTGNKFDKCCCAYAFYKGDEKSNPWSYNNFA